MSRQGLVVASLLMSVWAVVASPSLTANGHVQKVGEEAVVKAAFLYNFAKFTEWGSLPSGAPVVLCVVGDTALLSAATQAVKGQHAGGRALDVIRPGDGTGWGGCQVLFVAGTEVSRASIALDRLRKRPVLTVSDGTSFARTAGIIEFYREGDRMRFAINVQAAERAGVRISSRLLGLAKIVRNNNAP